MSLRARIELAPERMSIDGRDEAWSGEQYIVLTLDNADFAVPLAAIQEVERVPPIVPAPGAPGWVTGIANLRGTILTIVDPGTLLGLQPWAQGSEARILVLRSGEPAAIGVDGVRGMRRLSPAPLIGVEDALPERLARYITGVHRSESGLIHALDLVRLLDDADARSNHPNTNRGTTALAPP